METIFALSSGVPPAGIAIIRVSGDQAGETLRALAGKLPDARRATVARLLDPAGEILDHALVLWMPGPATVTGEDMAELHLHGGRAIIASVEKVLAERPGLRRAEAGEFTRRAFANGRIDLAEAEGLADLLQAETELQRRSALALADGALSRKVDDWRERLLLLGAQVEAVLDFDDEDDVTGLPPSFADAWADLQGEISMWIDGPRAERLNEGFRVVLVGPPNSGKSTLFNALVEDEAAITSPIAGTTRDVIERSVAIEGIAFSFSDTAGLRDNAEDTIEAIGIERATSALEAADVVLWLGPEGDGPKAAWDIETMIDEVGREQKRNPTARISAVTGEGIDGLKTYLVQRAREILPGPGQVAINRRQRDLLVDVQNFLAGFSPEADLLVTAEQLRGARVAFDNLTGRASTEDMLDVLFGRFCIGK